MSDEREDDPGAIIIAFPTNRGKTDVEVAEGAEKRTPTNCYHQHYGVMLHPATRTVTCKSCDATIEAFDVLMNYAEKQRSWRDLAGETRVVAKQIDDARKELKRVQDATKRANLKDKNTAIANERRLSLERMKRVFKDADEIATLASRIRQAAAVNVGVKPLKRCSVCRLAGLETCSHFEYPPTYSWQRGEVVGGTVDRNQVPPPEEAP